MPADYPLVSIVIPHLNRSGLLAETLHSIGNQDYPCWEVIVVDDGSVESEWQALLTQQDDKVRVLRRVDEPEGPSSCRNLGLEQARGELVLFVDSDDILAPWCLSQRVRCAADNPQVDAWVFPVMLFHKRPADIGLYWNRLEGEDDLLRFLRSDPPWHTSSPLWRKSALVKSGGFNEKLLYGDDSDLHIRALLRAVRFEKFPRLQADLFIRRGDQPRITNTGSQYLFDSRCARLQEGTLLMNQYAVGSQERATWEGQYFIEAEELLFNLPLAKPSVDRVLDLWVQHYQPGICQSWLVRSYFAFGCFFRDRNYFLLRCARRLVKLLLPGTFFRAGGEFQQWQENAAMLEQIRARLRTQ